MRRTELWTQTAELNDAAVDGHVPERDVLAVLTLSPMSRRPPSRP